MSAREIAIVGGGIFGITAAIELRARGYEVTLFEPGPVPHPLAESTDISKIVRLDYGDDALYTALMETALERWRTWSAARFFHETGVLFLRQSAMEPGSFEGDSFELLGRRGHRVERYDPARFPAWSSRYVDGYFNPQGGYAESGRVVAHLAEVARAAGIRIAEGVTVERVLESGSRVTGVVLGDGTHHLADAVIVAAGAWTPRLLPSMREHLHTTGQPVFHLEAPSGVDLGAARFPVFAADIARTGYYGFPVQNGIVKIANHGAGRVVDPSSVAERVVTEGQTSELRAFLAASLPSLAAAPVASTRVCVYCDTWDQHLWIAPDPAREGLVVAAGGSGHAFKFAPLLGGWIADALDGIVVDRFRWRPDVRPQRGAERARKQDA